MTLDSTAGLCLRKAVTLASWPVSPGFSVFRSQYERQHLQPCSCPRVNGPSTGILRAITRPHTLITTIHWGLVLCLMGKEIHLFWWTGGHKTNTECLPLAKHFVCPHSKTLSSYIKSARNTSVHTMSTGMNMPPCKAICITEVQHPFVRVLLRYLSFLLRSFYIEDNKHRTAGTSIWMLYSSSQWSLKAEDQEHVQGRDLSL